MLQNGYLSKELMKESKITAIACQEDSDTNLVKIKCDSKFEDIGPLNKNISILVKCPIDCK
jgi:hypothetical protein